MKKTCLLKARRGDPPAVLLRCVDFLPTAEQIYEAYWEIDRSEVGYPIFNSMQAVLTEYGWTATGERRAVRALWRAMYAEEKKAREDKRQAAEAVKEAAGQTGGRPRRRRGRSELGDFEED